MLGYILNLLQEIKIPASAALPPQPGNHVQPVHFNNTVGLEYRWFSKTGHISQVFKFHSKHVFDHSKSGSVPVF